MIDNRTAPYAALLLRVSLGILLLAHGLLLKVFTFTIPGTVGFFESIGFPGFLAYLVILGEIGGGIALILGLRTREISLLLPADPDRCDPAARWKWLALLCTERRLGVSGLPDCDGPRAGASRRPVHMPGVRRSFAAGRFPQASKPASNRRKQEVEHVSRQPKPARDRTGSHS